MSKNIINQFFAKVIEEFKNVLKPIPDYGIEYEKNLTHFITQAQLFEKWTSHRYAITSNTNQLLSDIKPPALFIACNGKGQFMMLMCDLKDEKIVYLNLSDGWQQKPVNEFSIQYPVINLVLEAQYFDYQNTNNKRDRFLAKRLNTFNKARLPFPSICFNKNKHDTDKVNECVTLFNDHLLIHIKNLFSKAFINNIHQEVIDQIISLRRKKQDKQWTNDENRRVFAIKVQNKLNDHLLFCNPVIDRIITNKLGLGYILNSMVCVLGKYGCNFQNMHADHPRIFEELNNNLILPSYAIALGVPLVPVNLESGTTRYLLMDKVNNYRLNNLILDQQPLEAEPGDCVLYDYRMIHQGTPTIIKKDRPFLFLIFSRAWFQETTPYRKMMRIQINHNEYKKVDKKFNHLFLQKH